MRKPCRVLTSVFGLLLVLAESPVLAQNPIQLSEEDMARLAIIFAPVTEIDRQSGSRFPATVTVSPEAVSVLLAPFSGTVIRWHESTGSMVGQDSTLATVRSQEILEIQNQWLSTTAQLEQAEFERSRDEDLFEDGIISRQRLQTSERQYQQTRSLLEVTVARLQQAGFSESEINSLSSSNARLGEYVLKASSAAVLSHRAVDVGEYVEAYNELASLQLSVQPWLRIQLPARLAASLKPGNSLSLAGSGEQLTLRQKNLEIDESTQTIELMAEFDSTVNYLPGRILSVIVPPADGGVLVPASAVVHNADETVVFVQSGSGIDARTLSLEAAGNNYVARSGLSVGELIVVQGASVLKGIQLGLGSDE
jgi:multidrug efflux pump subunit AcrA (membrane-fusion protein)